jgi:hypothetical protein
MIVISEYENLEAGLAFIFNYLPFSSRSLGKKNAMKSFDVPWQIQTQGIPSTYFKKNPRNFRLE